MAGVLLKKKSGDGKLHQEVSSSLGVEEGYLGFLSPFFGTAIDRKKVLASSTEIKRRPKFLRRKRGESQRRKRQLKRGEENQARFGEIMDIFIWRLKQLSIPKFYFWYSASERRDLSNEKISVRDGRGDDYALFFKWRGEEFRVIYDIKSSRIDAEDFNKDILLIGSQRNARLKKALVVNDHRVFYEVIAEVVDDAIRIGVSCLRQHRTRLVGLYDVDE